MPIFKNIELVICLFIYKVINAFEIETNYRSSLCFSRFLESLLLNQDLINFDMDKQIENTKSNPNDLFSRKMAILNETIPEM